MIQMGRLQMLQVPVGKVQPRQRAPTPQRTTFKLMLTALAAVGQLVIMWWMLFPPARQVRSVQRGKQRREKIQTQLPSPPLVSGTSPPITLGICCTGGQMMTQTVFKKKTHKVIPLGLLPLDDCELVWNITDACTTISCSVGRDTDGKVKAINGTMSIPPCPYFFQDTSVANQYWWCGYSTLPVGWTSRCARVQAILPIMVLPLDFALTQKGS